MPKKLVSINLIKDQKGDLIERIINWSLGIGRILVIITELIALGAFLWRFGLDQQLVDLHTQIKQKQVIVDAFKKQENEYRNIQDRLDIISNFSVLEENKLKIYKDIIILGSTNVIFNRVSMNTSKVSMVVEIKSISALSTFINSLKAYGQTASISIDKIETKTSNAIIIVGITVTLKPMPNKYASSTQ
jgi:hypothetical protein